MRRGASAGARQAGALQHVAEMQCSPECCPRAESQGDESVGFETFGAELVAGAADADYVHQSCEEKGRERQRRRLAVGR